MHSRPFPRQFGASWLENRQVLPAPLTRPSAARMMRGIAFARCLDATEEMTAMRRLLTRLLPVFVVLGVAPTLVQFAGAQKRGGTLAMVRPTDPVWLDP